MGRGQAPRQAAWTLGVVFFAATFVTLRYSDPSWFKGKGTEGMRHSGSQFADVGMFTSIARRLLGDPSAKGRALSPDPFCLAMEADGWARTDAAKAFVNPALRELNALFLSLNEGLLGAADAAVCAFTRNLNLSTLPVKLPAAAEGELAGKHVRIEAEVPHEAWVTEFGYTTKGTVIVDGILAAVIYWDGRPGASRGFKIEGIQGAGEGEMRKTGYLQWDRTGTKRFVRWLGAEFDEGYLGNAAELADPAIKPDRAVHAELTYDSFSGALALFAVTMEPQRGKLAQYGKFGCFRTYARGTKGDAMLVARTGGDRGLAGHARNTTFRDATELDAIWLKDAPDSPADEGTLTDFQFTSLVETELDAAPFPWTCNDLYTGGIHGGPFGGPDNDVNFDARPADVF